MRQVHVAASMRFRRASAAFHRQCRHTLRHQAFHQRLAVGGQAQEEAVICPVLMEFSANNGNILITFSTIPSLQVRL